MQKKIPILVVRGGIEDIVLTEVERQVSGKSGDELYVVIESNGGDPSIAYRVMNMLQAKYTKICAIVPTEAYSAATLMALGADKIYMRRSACLGPLDTQIPHPTDGSMISSLEIRDTPATLAGLVSSFSAGFNDDLLNRMGLGKKDAAKISTKTAIELIRPIAEKIDPIYLQKSTRSSKLGQKYAENLLTTRMMSERPRLAEAVSIYLANNYDYHGYAIMLDEAKGLLGLNVDDTANLEIWTEVKAVFESAQSRITYAEIDAPEDLSPGAGHAINKKEASEKSSNKKESVSAKMSWKGGA